MSNFLEAKSAHQQLECASYDKSEIHPGVMHLGVGAFHRAHQLAYFEQLLARSDSKHWGIVGVNIRPQDSKGFAQLQAQAGEYILKTMAPNGITDYQHIRAISQLVDGAIEPDKVDQIMAEKQIKLITTTVTEGGYYLDENHVLMLDNPLIKADLEGERNTLYAFLYHGLKRRSQTSNTNITLLCCDNLRHNGQLLKTGLLQFLIAKKEDLLHAWVLRHVSFPSSMVDRITPRPSPVHMADVQARFELDDQMTVMAEDFMQWVIEDDFANDKPRLDTVGAQLVKDVAPFEEAKIRILNAGHTCLAYQAALQGLTYFDEAMAAPPLKQFFNDFISQEAIPALGESEVNLVEYADIISARFSNANIGDTVERICTDGYAKFPIFVYPSLEGVYLQGGKPNKCLEAIASWFVFIHLAKQGQLNIHYHEPNLHKLAPFSNDEQGIHAFATDAYLWKTLPTSHPRFISDLKQAIHQAQVKYIK